MNIVSKLLGLCIALCIMFWSLVAMLFVDGHVPGLFFAIGFLMFIFVLGRNNANTNL